MIGFVNSLNNKSILSDNILSKYVKYVGGDISQVDVKVKTDEVEFVLFSFPNSWKYNLELPIENKSVPTIRGDRITTGLNTGNHSLSFQNIICTDIYYKLEEYEKTYLSTISKVNMLAGMLNNKSVSSELTKWEQKLFSYYQKADVMKSVVLTAKKLYNDKIKGTQKPTQQNYYNFIQSWCHLYNGNYEVVFNGYQHHDMAMSVSITNDEIEVDKMLINLTFTYNGHTENEPSSVSVNNSIPNYKGLSGAKTDLNVSTEDGMTFLKSVVSSMRKFITG